jgi:hypothetical protein
MNQKTLSNNNHQISAPAVSLRLIVQIQWQALGLCPPFLPSSLTTAHPVQEGMWRSCGTAAAAFKKFHIIYQILVFGQQGTISYQTESRNETKKGDLDVDSSFCAGFYESGTMLRRLGFSFFRGHFPSDIQQITIERASWPIYSSL